MRRQNLGGDFGNGDDAGGDEAGGDGGDANGADDLDDGSVDGNLSTRMKTASAAVLVMLTAVMRTRPLTGILFGRRNSRNVVTQNDDKGINTTTPRSVMLH